MYVRLKHNILASILLVAGLVSAAALASPKQSPEGRISVDLSKIPEGKWVSEKLNIPGIPSDEKQTFYVWDHVVPLPKEWKQIKSFEEEGSLPTLTITKKALEADGKIIPLEDLIQETDPSKIDRSALRRSLLHHLLTQYKRDEVSIQPVNLKRTLIPGDPEFLEHHDTAWGRPKQFGWLVADILMIEYLQQRKEPYWKTGALVGAHYIIGSVNVGRFGDVKDTFPIGAAVAYLYLVPNLKYAVPQVCSNDPHKPLDCLLSISSLYAIAGKSPDVYPNLHSSILDIERKVNPDHMNIHCEEFAAEYERRGNIKTALQILKRYEPRACAGQPVNERIQNKIAELEALEVRK